MNYYQDFSSSVGQDVFEDTGGNAGVQNDLKDYSEELGSTISEETSNLVSYINNGDFYTISILGQPKFTLSLESIQNKPESQLASELRYNITNYITDFSLEEAMALTNSIKNSFKNSKMETESKSSKKLKNLMQSMTKSQIKDLEEFHDSLGNSKEDLKSKKEILSKITELKNKMKKESSMMPREQNVAMSLDDEDEIVHDEEELMKDMGKMPTYMKFKNSKTFQEDEEDSENEVNLDGDDEVNRSEYSFENPEISETEVYAITDMDILEKLNCELADETNTFLVQNPGISEKSIYVTLPDAESTDGVEITVINVVDSKGNKDTEAAIDIAEKIINDLKESRYFKGLPQVYKVESKRIKMEDDSQGDADYRSGTDVEMGTVDLSDELPGSKAKSDEMEDFMVSNDGSVELTYDREEVLVPLVGEQTAEDIMTDITEITPSEDDLTYVSESIRNYIKKLKI